MYGGNSRGLRYYPRLKLFKQPNGRNWFDGVEARSYGWYQYAHVLLNGEIVEVSKSYSNITTQHMSAFYYLMGPAKYRVLAPRGLDHLGTARDAIKYEIKRLEGELKNPRNRNRQGRMDEIARLKAMLPVIKMLEKDVAARKRIARKAIGMGKVA
jgi:hypothetical protein